MIDKKEIKLVYICGPYRSKEGMNGVYENIQRARKYAVKYWMKGYAVICPHMNTAFMDGVGTDDIFLDGDIEMIKRVDIVVMMPGWNRSKGSINEKKFAAKLKKKIIYEKPLKA